jgi:hypothetical protein
MLLGKDTINSHSKDGFLTKTTQQLTYCTWTFIEAKSQRCSKKCIGFLKYRKPKECFCWRDWWCHGGQCQCDLPRGDQDFPKIVHWSWNFLDVIRVEDSLLHDFLAMTCLPCLLSFGACDDWVLCQLLVPCCLPLLLEKGLFVLRYFVAVGMGRKRGYKINSSTIQLVQYASGPTNLL